MYLNQRYNLAVLIVATDYHIIIPFDTDVNAIYKLLKHIVEVTQLIFCLQ